MIARAGKNTGHLKTVDHNIGSKLATMKGFTKDFWGTRAAISGLFKLIPRGKWSHKSTYLKSKQQLEEDIIKRRLPFENGGVFTPAEITYFRDYYQEVSDCLEEFKHRLENPDDDLADHFWEYYAQVTRKVKAIETDLNSVIAGRAQILFRSQSRKKKDQEWAKRPLQDKIRELSLEQLKKFSPCLLPGITSVLYKVETEHPDFETHVTEKYHIDTTVKFREKVHAICTAYEEMLDLLAEA
jgi:hypothetical protein